MLLSITAAGSGIKVRGRQPNSSSLESQTQPLFQRTLALFHPWTPHKAQLSVPGGGCVQTPSVCTHLFQFFWLHFLNPEDSGPGLLSVICQTFVQPHKRKGGWLLKEQFLHSIFTPRDIALVPKITPDHQGLMLLLPFHLVIL